MGTINLAAASTTSSGSSTYSTLLLFAVMIAAFYFFILRPQRRRQRTASQQQSQIMPGQRIRTTAGMYGTVVSGDDRDIVIEIAPGVHVTMLRRAIMDVIPDEYEATAPQDDVMDAGSYEAAPTQDTDVAEDTEDTGHGTEHDKKK